MAIRFNVRGTLGALLVTLTLVENDGPPHTPHAEFPTQSANQGLSAAFVATGVQRAAWKAFGH